MILLEGGEACDTQQGSHLTLRAAAALCGKARQCNRQCNLLLLARHHPRHKAIRPFSNKGRKSALGGKGAALGHENSLLLLRHHARPRLQDAHEDQAAHGHAACCQPRLPPQHTARSDKAQPRASTHWPALRDCIGTYVAEERRLSSPPTHARAHLQMNMRARLHMDKLNVARAACTIHARRG